MASPEVITRFNQAKNDLITIRSSRNYSRIGQDVNTNKAISDAESAATRWAARAEREGLQMLQDSTLSAITTFMTRIVAIIDGRETLSAGTYSDALRIARQNFEASAPVLALDFLESSRVLDIANELAATKMSVLNEIKASTEESKNQIEHVAAESHERVLTAARSLQDEIKATAAEAVKEYELAKENASRISVNAAREQFESAELHLRNRANSWTATSFAFFASLIIALVLLYSHPPVIIGDIEDAIKPGSRTVFPPVPFTLLLAASAYFTSVRLALIGVLSVGFAVSIRMMRAYFHMREHNEHKLRVTNSIEAFVAAVRTKEQKDLVLGKLVESVTEFGDSGILGKQSESSSLPSVMLEAITKNVSKGD